MNLSLILEKASSLGSPEPGAPAAVLFELTSGAAVGAGPPTNASLRLMLGLGLAA